MAMTVGTAKPNAQGHEATNIPIPRSNTQQTWQIYTSARFNISITDHTIIVIKLKKMTLFTKISVILMQTAWIPDVYVSSWFCENFTWVNNCISKLCSKAFYTYAKHSLTYSIIAPD